MSIRAKLFFSESGYVKSMLLNLTRTRRDRMSTPPERAETATTMEDTSIFYCLNYSYDYNILRRFGQLTFQHSALSRQRCPGIISAPLYNKIVGGSVPIDAKHHLHSSVINLPAGIFLHPKENTAMNGHNYSH